MLLALSLLLVAGAARAQVAAPTSRRHSEIRNQESAAPPQPGFDPKEIVRQCRPELSASRSPTHAPRPLTFGLDDGEFLIDTSFAPAPYDQEEPAIAFDGTNFLVVWQDDRSGYSDIYGARVTPQGTVLDPAGFVVSQAASYQQSPALAYDGANFLVVWQDYRSVSYSDIYGARVTPQGTVLDPSGFVISRAAYDQESPALGFGGANFLVVWEDERSGDSSVIYGARVTPAGTVLDPAGVVISSAADWPRFPAVAFDGANFLVVWEDYRGGDGDIYGARVTPQGTVLDPNGFVISQGTSYRGSPALAYDGANFLVVWEDRRSGSNYDIYGARVTPQGTVLEPSGFVISQAADDQYYPALGFDGANFLAVWQDYRNNRDTSDIYGARVTPQGFVLDPNGIVISQARYNQYVPALGFDGANSLVVWQDRCSGTAYDIYGARVTPQGTVLDPAGFLISQAARGQWSPALGFDGTNFLVVWTDERGVSYDIYGARVTPQGTVLDPAGFVISQATYDQWSPALSFDGASFLVAWQDYRNSPDTADIYGARVSQAGAVLDPAGIPISTAVTSQQQPAVSFDGTNFLVAWEDYRNGPYADIYGARVSPTGAVLDPAGIAISTATYGQGSPAVSSDGTNSLVVWTDSRCGSSWDMYGARLNRAGTVLEPAGILVSAAAGWQGSPAASFDGTNFLVVWQDDRSGTYSDIYGARVSRAGVVLDTAGIPISTAASWQYCPAVSFDGTNWLVVWQDQRSGSYDIYAARVTPAGVVFDTGPAVRQEGNQLYPALARGTGNQMFLVYQGWAGTVGGKTYNTDRIWGKFGPFPGVQEPSNGEVRRMNRLPTVVRGVLELEVGSRQHTAYRAELLDISGRKVLDLRPGPNDVSRLAPGVYFILGEGSRGQGLAGSSRKVIVTR
jgi:hypothetical protein